MSPDSFEHIADQFLDDCRRGDDPVIDSLVGDHPEWSDEIKDVLPTALLMEQFKRQRNFGRVEADRGVKFGTSYLRKLGDYRIIREIGRGGMGIVYEAEQESLKRRVALKVLRPSMTMDEKTAARFEREAQAAAVLHHTNIVPVFGVGQQDDVRYYVMQLIEGKTLDTITKESMIQNDSKLQHGSSAGDSNADDANTGDKDGGTETVSRFRVSHSQLSNGRPPQSSQLLEDPQALVDLQPLDDPKALSESRPAQSGSTELAVGKSKKTETPVRKPQDWRWMASVGIEICDALRHAHQHGILHRDIKPGNVLVDDNGGVWITDFGLAKPADAAAITETGDAVGTLRYMAPEQLDGISNVQTDLYSLGITLYELATGVPAYVHKDRAQLLQMIIKQEPVRPRKLVPNMPRDFETIMLKSIAREPKRRYQDASEFEDDLRRFLDYRPIRARRASIAERMWRWCRRNPAVAIPTMVAFILLLCLASVASTGYLKVTNALAETDQQRERAENNRQQAERNLTIAALERERAVTQRQRAENNLVRVQEEQKRAQANLELSLDALEAVFQRFAPNSIAQNEDVGAGDEGFDPRFDSVITQPDVELLKSMLQFYDDFAQQNNDDERLQREAAQAYRRVGDIHTRLGAFSDAQGAYDRAVEIYSAVCEGLVVEHELRRQLAAVQNDLGLVLKMQGRFNVARNLHLKALGSLRQQLALEPDSIEINLELVRTYNFLGYTIWGSFRRNQDPNVPTLATAAEENHRAALETLTKLIAKDSHNPDYQLILARSHRDMVPVLMYRRRFPKSSENEQNLTATERRQRDEDRQKAYLDRQAEAAESMQKACDILEDLVERYPRVPTYKYELVRTLTNPFRRRVSSELDRESRVLELIGHQKTALGLAEELATDYPDVPEYSARVAYTNRSLAEYYELIGDTGSSEEHSRVAFKRMSEQVNNYSQVPTYRLYLAFIAQRLIEILNDSNRVDESRELILQMLEQTEHLEFGDEDRRERGMLFFVRDRLTRTLCSIELGEIGQPTADEE